MNRQEAAAAFQADRAHLEACGVILPQAKSYLPDEFRRDFALAMDAMPALMTDPNSAIPAYLTTMVDPTVLEIVFAPSKAAKIATESKKGTWLDDTAMFPTVEHTGEVSSYGDFNTNGRAGANTTWPQRQSYLFQTVKEYGERELERADLARINWASQIDKAAATVSSKFLNLTYFYGVAGLQNYGLLNDPGLSASLTPATKVAGGVKWVNSGQINASANEVYADIQALFIKLVSQTGGLVDKESKMVLAMSPSSDVALTATNSFNVNVYDLLKKNFPNIRFETAVQYGALSTSNPQGVAGGELVQLIADEIEGEQSVLCAFNEKMRAHAVIKDMSSFKQKVTGGTWGAIVRRPMAFAQMLGV